MTPHRSDVPARVVWGLFTVAFIGLLALLARGYHTLVLILIGVMCGIGALTFTYDPSRTLEGLAIVASVGILSLLMQGYYTLLGVITLTSFGIGAIVFLSYDGQHLWHWWFPDQPFIPTVKRWLRYLVMTCTAALAYVQVRIYLNDLTEVDPHYFPTALAALTALNTLRWWLLVLLIVMLVTAGVSAGVAYMAKLRGQFGPAEIGGISARRWGWRAFGAFSLAVVSVALASALEEVPWSQRAGGLIATTVLVATEFSYDRTCAISSEHRLVAHLKDPMISIAEEHFVVWFIFRHFTFSRGTCDEHRPPVTFSRHPPEGR
jgi:hypothetical protein